MEPRFVTKPAFTVVGIPFVGLISNAPYEEGKGNNDIGQVWDELNRRRSEITSISGPAIGLSFGMPNESRPWYIAGFEVEQGDQVPAGMMSMSVPEHEYAVFTCTLDTLGATYRYITEEWQAKSGHRHVEAPDFELYDETFNPNDPGRGQLYVYWPIK